MTKSQEKISAWYDGEVTQKEFNAGLSDLTNLADSKQALHQFALLSELMQRKKRLSSKVTKIREYASKNNMWISNALTAAASVLVTITILFQIDSDRFGVDKDRQMQLTSALSSPAAKNQLIVADQDVMDHIIHIMQSNKSNGSQAISKEWIPVGFKLSEQNPNKYTNGSNNLFFHVEAKAHGFKKVQYFQANKGWIYLIPLRDGRLLTAYGDVPPKLASKMIQSIN